MSFFFPVRPFARKCSRLPAYGRYFSICEPRDDPLRILFCGSDEFSCASLDALDHDRRKNKASIIESIDVVCRPPKRVGRGLKRLRNVPIEAFAHEVGLPLHQIDTFTGWQPPPQINLIIAVSFGLFVPPRILKGAKYGGLNIHPSMLPERPYTGVSLQTLHHAKFDHGTILAQTPFPGLPINPSATPDQLHGALTGLGAKLLVDAINARLYDSPVKKLSLSEQQIDTITAGKGIAHAPKITPSDREISWSSTTTSEVLHRDHVLGRLWDTSTYGSIAQDPTLKNRVVYSQGFWHDAALSGRFQKVAGEMNLPAGTPIILHGEGSSIGITTTDGVVLVKGCTVQNGQKDAGVRELVRLNEKVELEESGTKH